MSFYVYLDKNGKEVGRVVRPRGRTKAGAKPNAEGNWEITLADGETIAGLLQGDSLKSAVQESIEDLKGGKGVEFDPEAKPKQVEPIAEADDEPAPKGGKTIKANKQYTVKELMSMIHYRDKTVNTTTIVINCALIGVSAELCKGWNVHHSNYSRLEIDRINKNLNIWILRTTGGPDLVIEGLFKDDGSDI